MMDVIETISAFRELRPQLGHVGFVPTMGYLHEGHLSLVRLARAANESVVVSIFVNPTQFGPNEDLSRYPRDLDRDLRLLRQEGVDVVFTPQATDIYPSGYGTYVNVRGVTEQLEGAVRPNHFEGVATVVCKLFNIVQPARAYFGQKDAQQVVVVKTMAHDLNMPLEVVVGPTIREADGLAMSSRNVYLNPEERVAAVALSRALRVAQQAYEHGERDGAVLRRTILAILEAEPLARPQYVSVADPLSLQELDQVGERGGLLSLAVYIGRTRLIDNILIGG